ncbi:hypothetical protein DIE06_21630 [Burkholderia sp. Bp8998]|nr:hypothetical protein DIE06_21630 [Burkholderia sp. Bp8998]
MVLRYSSMKVPSIGLRCLVLICSAGAAQFARADCFDHAAAYQHVNPLILRAIAWQESHNRADAMHVNANGSVDYGMMQINSIHLSPLSRFGIGREALMSPCKSVYVAAWLLRRQVDKYGNTWAAVGAYHSATPSLRDDYARRISGILRRWKMLPDDRSGIRTAQQPEARPIVASATEPEQSTVVARHVNDRHRPAVDARSELELLAMQADLELGQSRR